MVKFLERRLSLLLFFVGFYGFSFSVLCGATQADLKEYEEIYSELVSPEISLEPLKNKAKLANIKFDVGAGLITFLVSNDTQRTFAITGKRFGLPNNYKLSVGGAVDPQDKNISDAFIRERNEEWFGQLPLRQIEYLLPHPHVAGGIKINEKTKEIKLKWGPYFTYSVVETGYSEDEIESAVNIMNMNAQMHFPLNAFFGTSGRHARLGEVEKLSVEEIKLIALNFLTKFAENKNQPGFQDLCPKARTVLESLAQDGGAELHAFVKEEGGYAEFGEKYMYLYTEYSDFRLQTLEELINSTDLYKAEKEARELSLEMLNK